MNRLTACGTLVVLCVTGVACAQAGGKTSSGGTSGERLVVGKVGPMASDASSFVLQTTDPIPIPGAKTLRVQLDKTTTIVKKTAGSMADVVVQMPVSVNGNLRGGGGAVVANYILVHRWSRSRSPSAANDAQMRASAAAAGAAVHPRGKVGSRPGLGRLTVGRIQKKDPLTLSRVQGGPLTVDTSKLKKVLCDIEMSRQDLKEGDPIVALLATPPLKKGGGTYTVRGLLIGLVPDPSLVK